MTNAVIIGSAPRLYVEELEKMLLFYVEILGFRIIGPVLPNYGMVERDGFQVHFAKFNSRFLNKNQPQHLILWIPEIALFFEEISRYNIKIIEPITLRNYGNREFVIEDPEGNTVTICD